jgi:hypothetical protein
LEEEQRNAKEAWGQNVKIAEKRAEKHDLLLIRKEKENPGQWGIRA